MPMTLRRRGRDGAADADSLARAFPDATARLAVFIHGLGETDDAWRIGAARHRPYGERLRTELGYTPLYVRFNTGLHISDNGRSLARLLGQVTAGWPTEVAEIALIGHSMGGLVARSACHYAAPGSWRERVRHVSNPCSERRTAACPWRRPSAPSPTPSRWCPRREPWPG